MTQHFPAHTNTRLWPLPQHPATNISWLAGSDASQTGGIENAGFNIVTDDGAVRTLHGFWETISLDNSEDVHGNGDPMLWKAQQSLPGYDGSPGLIAILDAFLDTIAEASSGASITLEIDTGDGQNSYRQTMSWNHTAGTLDVLFTIGQQDYGPYGYGVRDVRRMHMGYGFRTELSPTAASVFAAYSNEVRMASTSVGTLSGSSLVLIPSGGFFSERASAYVNGHVLPQTNTYTVSVTLSVPAGKAQTFRLLGAHVLHNRRRMAEQAHLLASPCVKMIPDLA